MRATGDIVTEVVGTSIKESGFPFSFGACFQFEIFEIYLFNLIFWIFIFLGQYKLACIISDTTKNKLVNWPGSSACDHQQDLEDHYNHTQCADALTAAANAHNAFKADVLLFLQVLSQFVANFSFFFLCFL